MAKTYKSTRKSYLAQSINPAQVNEPLAALQVMPNPLAYISSLLGLSGPVNSEMQYIQASRQGIKKAALGKLAFNMGITQEKMCQLLHISTRTYQRLKDADTLDIFTSEQAIEMAQVLAKAQSVFETDTLVKQWLHTPLLALGGTAPLDLLDTGFGAKLVLDTLGRLEQGVYS
ncbi:MAG: DUF2384 domain-containing protein [Bacteroidota bacterium]|nr:DUF2384 domain-containing protein [Bacteroidota bacterium]